ncbi:MAG: TolC family protein [candidate division WOR-3 bacterium]
MIFILALFFISVDTLHLTLDDALKIAKEKSPSRIAAVLDSRTGRSKFIRSVTALLPRIQATANYSVTSQPITTRTWTGSIGLNQVVFSVDIFGNLIIGKNTFDYYQQKAKDATNNLVYNIKSGYFNLIKFYNLHTIAQASLRRATESYNLMQEKFRLGQISQIDLLRAEAFMTQAEIDLLTADKNLKVANEDFKGQLGIEKDVLIKPVTELTEPADFEYKDLESIWYEVLENNPSLKVARQTQKIAQLNLWRAIGQMLPEINYYLTNNYSDTVLPKSFCYWQEHDRTTLGFTFNFPILELKSVIHNIYDAQLESQNASVRLKESTIALRKSITSAFLSFQEAKERYNYAQKNLKLNQQLYELAKEQFRLGALSILDLFDIELKLGSAQTTYINALADTHTSKAWLDYLLGK